MLLTSDPCDRSPRVPPIAPLLLAGRAAAPRAARGGVAARPAAERQVVRRAGTVQRRAKREARPSTGTPSRSAPGREPPIQPGLASPTRNHRARHPFTSAASRSTVTAGRGRPSSSAQGARSGHGEHDQDARDECFARKRAERCVLAIRGDGGIYAHSRIAWRGRTLLVADHLLHLFPHLRRHGDVAHGREAIPALSRPTSPNPRLRRPAGRSWSGAASRSDRFSPAWCQGSRGRARRPRSVSQG